MKWSSGSCRPAVGRRVQTSAVGCARQSGVVGCARQSGAAAWRSGAAWRGGAEAWRVGAEAWQSGRGSRALWSSRAFGCARQSGAVAWRSGAEAWRGGAEAWQGGAEAWQGGAEAWRGGGGGGAFGCSPYILNTFVPEQKKIHPRDRTTVKALRCAHGSHGKPCQDEDEVIQDSMETIPGGDAESTVISDVQGSRLSRSTMVLSLISFVGCSSL